jgi:hypothetical protein
MLVCAEAAEVGGSVLGQNAVSEAIRWQAPFNTSPSTKDEDTRACWGGELTIFHRVFWCEKRWDYATSSLLSCCIVLAI